MARKAPRGKTSKSEQVSIRLEPKIYYGLELLARQNHRTIAATIETAINLLLGDPRDGLKLPLNRNQKGIDLAVPVKTEPALDKLWHTNEPDRLALLAFNKPELMDYEEKQIWEHVQNTSYFWVRQTIPYVDMPVKEDPATPALFWDTTDERLFLYPNFREMFPLIKQYVDHEIPLSALEEAVGIEEYRPALTSQGAFRFIYSEAPISGDL